MLPAQITGTSVRGTWEWICWLRALADHAGGDVTDVICAGIRRVARDHKFTEPEPRRLPVRRLKRGRIKV